MLKRNRFESTLLSLLDWILILAISILVLDVLLGVFSRFIMGHQVQWTEELACVMLVWVSFLGTAAAFARKAHLGIDIVVSHFPTNIKRCTNIAAHMTTLFFIAVTFIYGGAMLVMHKHEMNFILPALQVPDVVMFISLPISGLFIFVFEFFNLIRGVQNPDADHNAAGND